MSAVKKINKDLGNIIDKLLKDKRLIEPWKEDEHKLLAPKLSKWKRVGLFNSFQKAFLLNIFGEKIGLVAVKTYKVHKLYVVVTSDSQIAFLENMYGTTWYIDGRQVAVALADGNIVSPDGKQLLIKVDYKTKTEYPVYNGESIVAGLPAAIDHKAVSPRSMFYYQVADQDLLKLLVCLNLHHIIEFNLKEVSS